MSSQPIHAGGCACGAVRVRVTGEPKEVNLCHCMTCRRIHGAPFGVYAIFTRAAFDVSGGTVAWESSATGKRHHCPTCGSPVYLAFDGVDEIEVPTGIFDETGLYPPQYEIWCKSAEPWHDAQGRPRFARGAP
ncbi:glutathione-dependent formaldehyde-activating protein [Caballeronia catudaia]|uniref:Glutathione-dependent formaldehyde-activating protein n=1 Tax=Caballeronia catudaia TaxID=1777136 RepID=A0A157ZU38_9BURK|nr:GFA family protein [Caballeronia catudaia]SAK49058.1 glutathione-dependent formaldehyde-activating protein [Caballeronia catudaia]